MISEDVVEIVDEIFYIHYDSIADIKENGFGVEFMCQMVKRFADIETDG